MELGMASARAKIIISSSAVFAFIVISYFFIDIPLARFCKGLDPSIRNAFGTITELGISTWYLISSFALFAIFTFIRPHRRYGYMGLFVFASIAVSGLLTNIIKVIFARYRPEMLFEKGLYGLRFFDYDDRITSFPSGHAATAFSLAFVLSHFFPKFRVPLFIFAVVVAASRVIITAHYISDAVAGAWLAMVCVFFLKKALASMERKASSMPDNQ
jgi:membrane-associated phospholipid phosphatase